MGIDCLRRELEGLDCTGNTYTALEVADEQALEDLAGLVAVADVFEGFGGVLAADVEEDFFTSGVLVYEAWGAREWLVESLR
jgi:hypothetical protein